MTKPPYITAQNLAPVPHGFFGRQGGVSTQEMASLNCGLGSGDDPTLIAANRAAVTAAIAAGADLAGAYQVHGNCCITLTGRADAAKHLKGDAMVTRVPGILLSILTADCVPVLFSDHEAGVVGAAHAGWKGALAGVTDSTLDAMEALGARRDSIVAAVGPCIGRASYEVDDGFVQRFTIDNPANEHFFVAGRPGHALFDIAAYVAARLAAAGVTSVAITGHDTYTEETEYFSYRRACHRDEGGYGRQISVIGVCPV